MNTYNGIENKRLRRAFVILRWSTRILALLLFVLLTFLFLGQQGWKLIGQCIMSPLRAQSLMTFALFFIAAPGLLIGWKREGLGSVMIVGGMALFYGINAAAVGRFPSGWVFPLLYVPGVLYGICGVADRLSRKREPLPQYREPDVIIRPAGASPKGGRSLD